MANDWFRNKSWDPLIEQDFLQHLGQAVYNDRITALKIQGDIWQANPDPATQQAGIRLLETLITAYADEPHEVATVQEILAMHFHNKADFENAERYLIPVLQFYKTYKRTGVIRRADFTMAEMIILRMITHRLEEALQLLINFPLTGGSISEEHEQYNYHEQLAYSYYLLDKKVEAAHHAASALTVAQTIELDFMIAKPAALEGYYQQLPSLDVIAMKA